MKTIISHIDLAKKLSSIHAEKTNKEVYRAEQDLIWNYHTGDLVELASEYTGESFIIYNRP